MRLPLTVPVAGTARRPAWTELPADLRRSVETALGAAVVGATSQGSGFTPGFASRLVLADGRTAFVKAAGPDHRWLVECYEQEADKLVRLPPAVPAPRLRHRIERSDGWLVLIFDDVDGRPPARPWCSDEARRVAAVTAEVARLLDPAPPGDWGALGLDLSGDAERWAEVRARDLVPDLAGRAESLAGAYLPRCTGSALVHGDLRDDNVIVGTDGRIWFCDWNFGRLGPVWADLVLLGLGWYGDGLDVVGLLRETGLLEGAEVADVDGLVALLLGYFLVASRQPPLPHSPYLRSHQSWYAQACAGWLRDGITPL